MLPNRGNRTSKLRRLAAIAVAGSLLVIGAVAPVSAQTFGGDGRIYATADCNLATKTASVFVTVLEPAKYASSGLVFYTELWAKARYETKYNFIKGAQSPTIKTWAYLQGYWTNNPTTVFSGAFTGRVEAYYDIYVRYWFRVPSSSSWAGPYAFTAATDPHSSITITSNNGYGNLTSSASDCSF